MGRIAPEGGQLVIDFDLLVFYIAANHRSLQHTNMCLLRSGQLLTRSIEYVVDGYVVGLGSRYGPVNVLLRGNGSAKK